jgi:hypothetical protein
MKRFTSIYNTTQEMYIRRFKHLYKRQISTIFSKCLKAQKGRKTKGTFSSLYVNGFLDGYIFQIQNSKVARFGKKATTTTVSTWRFKM